MSLMIRALVGLAAAGVISVPTDRLVQSTSASSVGRQRPVVSQPKPAVEAFTSADAEYYLTEDNLSYIRPGIKVEIVSITDVAPGKKPVIEVKLMDQFNQPLDRLGNVTPGPISLSFILASYDPVTRVYTSYYTRVATSGPTAPNPNFTTNQATSMAVDAVDLELGRVKYTARTALPATMDLTKTHTLGIYGTRNLADIIEKTYYVNLEHDFRPDGAAVTNTWDKMRDASTCLNCHDPLSAHGGSRRDVKLCALCHSPQTVDPDTGNTVDMKVMAHKIHFGEHLPSVQAGQPYIIIGNRGSVHDYSHVVLPQDPRNCQNCHVGTDPDNVAVQADNYLTKPSAAACGSCHDDVNFATGANHAAGAFADDSACATCHIPDSGNEFDASIKGAHVIPEKSSQLKGLNVTVVSASNMTPGQKPTVVFKITNGDGSFVDGSKLTTFAPMIAGSTAGYSKYFRESAVGKATFDAAAGTSTYTFTNAIPADATGSWAISADVYRNATIKRTDGKADITLREAAVNPIKYVALDGGAATPRRTSVTMAQCNSCHDRLALHGGQRLVIEECVMCHNPKETDKARRPADAGAPESVSFQRMIHRIHAGSNLTQDFTVYGFGNTAHNYNHVVYPGDLRNCEKCHVAGAQMLPVADGAGMVITERDYFTPQGPDTAACLGCHDSRQAAAHAYINATDFGREGENAEACASCHGEGKQAGVDRVHAR